MSCREYRSGLIEWGRGRAPGEAARLGLVRHLEECADCARFLETQQALSAALADLAASPIPPADEFLPPVMAEFDRMNPRRRTLRPFAWVAAAALAATILLAVILLSHRSASRMVVLPHRAAAVLVTPPASSAAVTTAVASQPAPRPAVLRNSAPEPEQPFYPIPYTAPLAPGEWTRVERMKIPVAALIAAGFDLVEADPAAKVEADVLVSQDGRARAIRPLSISVSN